MSSRASSRIQALTAALLFSTGGAAIKATTLTGWQVASFRSGVAALAVMILVPEARRLVSWRAWLVGVAYAACLTLYVSGNKLTTAANTIFLQSTAPLYVVILGPLLLRETARARDFVFMVALAPGIALLFLGTGDAVATAPDPSRGNLLAAGSGAAWALTVVGLRWLGRVRAPDRTPPLAAVTCGNILAFAFGLPFAVPVERSTPLDWILIAFLGVVQIGLAYAFLTRALRLLPALEASLLIMVEPVLNPVFAWIVHGERPTTLALAGGAIILAATIVKTWASSREQGPQSAI